MTEYLKIKLKNKEVMEKIQSLRLCGIDISKLVNDLLLQTRCSNNAA